MVMSSQHGVNKGSSQALTTFVTLTTMFTMSCVTGTPERLRMEALENKVKDDWKQKAEAVLKELARACAVDFPHEQEKLEFTRRPVAQCKLEVQSGNTESEGILQVEVITPLPCAECSECMRSIMSV